MLELLDWGKKQGEEAAGSGSGPKPAQAAPAVEGDAGTALAELNARLEGVADAADPKARIGALGAIQDAGAAQVAALLGQYLGGTAGTHAAREVLWNSLAGYQTRLAQALCAAAGAALTLASATRALRALRVLAKLHLVHYAGMPGKLWRVAYAIHAGAERAGFAATPVRVRADEHTMTTVEQELLRLLMLRVSAPDMMAPEQIEIADRVIEELGAEFTLRPPGVADNAFCFEPGSEFAPRRAQGRAPGTSARYFGPGMGHDSLKRIARQLTAAGRDGFKAYGKDIAPGVQQSAVQHLLLFWRDDCPYAPPAHASASGTLQVVHGYDALWQHLSRSRQGPAALSLAEWSPAAAQPPETWPLRGEGGNELAAEVPAASRAWAKCGAVVGVSSGEDARWVGMVRRMHAQADGSLRADLAVLSRAPRALSLREVVELGDDSAFTNASSRQFAVSGVNAVILAEGAGDAQPANLLVPAAAWKEGRVYETSEDPPRQLRTLQVVRRGDDFVRATFEWLAAPA